MSGKHYHYHKVNIEEHRAPTDESVRLLNELTDKARKNILAVIHVKENFIEAVVIYHYHEFITGRVVYGMKFKINGYEHSVQGYFDKFQWGEEGSKLYYGLGDKRALIVLVKAYTEKIMESLLPDIERSYYENGIEYPF